MRLSGLSTLALAAVVGLAACGGGTRTATVTVTRTVAAPPTRPRGVPIPYVLELREPLATKRMDDAGFRVRVVRRRSAAVAAGAIYAQSPPQGTYASSGSTVTLFVSDGRLPYPLLVNTRGWRVYGPPERAHAPCPKALPPRAQALRTVKRAVTLAMPPFEARLKLNGREARIKVGPAVRSGHGAAAGGCGELVWRRSIVASVRLPHVFGASLSQHTFAVARIRQGWIMWAWIH